MLAIRNMDIGLLYYQLCLLAFCHHHFTTCPFIYTHISFIKPAGDWLYFFCWQKKWLFRVSFIYQHHHHHNINRKKDHLNSFHLLDFLRLLWRLLVDTDDLAEYLKKIYTHLICLLEHVLLLHINFMHTYSWIGRQKRYLYTHFLNVRQALSLFTIPFFLPWFSSVETFCLQSEPSLFCSPSHRHHHQHISMHPSQHHLFRHHHFAIIV